MIAAGFTFIRPVAIRVIIALLVLGIQLYHTKNYYQDFVKEPWDQITTYIGSRIGNNDAILFFPKFTYIPFQYYFRKFEVPQYYVSEKSLKQKDALLNATLFDRVWFVIFDRIYRDPEDRRQHAFESHYRRFRGAAQFELFLFEKPGRLPTR